jgi:hypothetical protein
VYAIISATAAHPRRLFWRCIPLDSHFPELHLKLPHSVDCAKIDQSLAALHKRADSTVGTRTGCSCQDTPSPRGDRGGDYGTCKETFSTERTPPLSFALALPVSRQRCNHLTAELALRLKLSATSRRDAPATTASITRSLNHQNRASASIWSPQKLPQDSLTHTFGNPRFNFVGNGSRNLEGSVRSRGTTAPGTRA